MFLSHCGLFISHFLTLCTSITQRCAQSSHILYSFRKLISEWKLDWKRKNKTSRRLVHFTVSYPFHLKGVYTRSEGDIASNRYKDIFPCTFHTLRKQTHFKNGLHYTPISKRNRSHVRFRFWLLTHLKDFSEYFLR